jgi:hypothetical protein
MKLTLSTTEAVNHLLADTNANWSYAGARALIEHLEELENANGEELELDVVALRCDYSEWDTALECAIEHGYEPNPNLGEDSQDASDKELDALDWLYDRSIVIKFPAGLIVSTF